MEISPVTPNIPECSPNLMPFHISHSGSAPISAYFRVKPSPSDAHLSFTQHAFNSTTDDTRNALIAEESQATIESHPASLAEDSQASAATVGDIVVGADSATQASSSSEAASSLSMIPTGGGTVKNNFVAAFRGRQIHGRTVDLPHGYSGIVLNSPLDGEVGDTEVVEKVAQTRGKGRATRQSSRKMGMDVDDTGDPDRGDAPNDASHVEIQRLIPISRFSSLTVWSPDIPVDERKDEYIRSLTEWTKLAAEVRFHV
jgi:hypothetical protein